MASTLDNIPKQLPKRLFLICGDHAWAGIPSRLLGGPCTLGQLTLFMPNISQITNWTNKTQLARQKRSFDELDENCNSEIFHWSHLKRSAMSLCYRGCSSLGDSALLFGLYGFQLGWFRVTVQVVQVLVGGAEWGGGFGISLCWGRWGLQL